MSFASLKKNRSNFSKLTQELEKTTSSQSNSSNKDERIWKPTVDKTGNGYAVIRFLPAPVDEDLPWARIFSHGFKGPGGWLIDNCLTTINQKCPICEANAELWATGSTANQNIVRERKRKLKYISNIYIVKDPSNPENEGKVFLYQYGKKIFDKLQDLMKPEFEDEDPINPFDFWGGANFKLKIRKYEGYQNYDKSEFDGASAVADNDEAIETIWDKQYPLKPFLAPENFKSYDELKAKLDKVLLGTRSTGTAEDVAIPPVTQSVEPVVQETVDTTSSPVDDTSDDTLDYFSKLAEEDA